MTDRTLEEQMFPREKSAANKRMPDYDYIRKELLRNGVNKKLLWGNTVCLYARTCACHGQQKAAVGEYCEDRRMAGDDPRL